MRKNKTPNVSDEEKAYYLKLVDDAEKDMINLHNEEIHEVKMRLNDDNDDFIDDLREWLGPQWNLCQYLILNMLVLDLLEDLPPM